MVGEIRSRTLSDDELVQMLDLPALWIGLNGPALSFRAALLGAAQISAAGRTPYKLKQPAENIEVDHAQMLRLWERLGLIPLKSSS